MLSYLEPLPIIRDEEHHKYFWEPTQEWLAYSTTGIIGAKKTPQQLATFGKTKHIWGPRGTHVHWCLEQFMRGNKDPDPMGFADWVVPILAHPFWNTFEPLAVEYMLCDLNKSVGGQLDLLGRDHKNDQLVLIDLKTQSSIRASKYSTDAQMGSYIDALWIHHRLKVDACRTVWARPKKTILGQEQTIDQCSQAWAEAWDYFSESQITSKPF